MREGERVSWCSNQREHCIPKLCGQKKADASKRWREACVVEGQRQGQVERMQLEAGAGPGQKSLEWPASPCLTSIPLHHPHIYTPYHSDPLCSRLAHSISATSSSVLFPEHSRHIVPSGLCTCYVPCLECSFPWCPRGWTSSHPSVSLQCHLSDTKLNSTPPTHTHKNSYTTHYSSLPCFVFL